MYQGVIALVSPESLFTMQFIKFHHPTESEIWRVVRSRKFCFRNFPDDFGAGSSLRIITLTITLVSLGQVSLVSTVNFWVVGVICIFCILTSIGYVICKCLLSFSRWLFFFFLTVSFTLQKLFNLMHSCLLVFVLFPYLRRHPKILLRCQRAYCPCFLVEVLWFQVLYLSL